MAWLVETELAVVQAGACKHADGACDHTCLVGKNIPEHIFGEDHIELGRVLHQLHGAIVHKHMLQRHLGIVLSDLLHDLAP